MAGIALSGLASGMDTESLVRSLIAAESGGRVRLSNRQVQAEQRVSTLQGIQGKLTSLKTALSGLGSVTNWLPTQQVSSSNEALVSATRTGGAGAGTYTVDVQSLASSTQRVYDYTPPAADDIMTFGSTSVTIAAGSTVDDAVSAINAEGGDVIAVNAGGRLVVSSTNTGVSSAFAWSSSGSALAMVSEKLGTDATYTIDGGAVQSSATNQVAGAMPGVDLRLSGLGAASVTIGAPAADADLIVDKFKAFVDAYNAVIDATHTATTEKPVKDAATSTDLKKGVLFGDMGLVRVNSQLRGAVGASVSGLSGTLSSLAELGITTGAATGGASSADSLTGKLSFDESKLRTALADHPSDVRELLGATAGVSGFTQQFGAVLDPITASGTGIADRVDQAGAEVTRLKDSLTRFDDRLSRREELLRKQFAAMESALAVAQQQQSRIGGQLAALMSSSDG